MHQFKLAFRNLLKYRFFTLINVFSLSIGILFLLVIAIYALGEYQVNKQLHDVDNTYVLHSTWDSNQPEESITTSAPVATLLASQNSSLVKDYCRISLSEAVLGTDERFFKERLQVVDPSFISMFGFKLLAGNPAAALNNPNQIVLTEKLAVKLFGNTNVLGQVVRVKTNAGVELPMQVSGVMANPYNNTVTNPDGGNPDVRGVNAFINMANISHFMGDGADKDWENRYMLSYVKLANGKSSENLIRAAKTLVDNHAPAALANLKIIPHALNNYYLEKNDGKAKKMLLSLGILAALIMGLSIFNYVNLLTASLLTRAKQSAVVRLMGAGKKHAVLQNMLESFLLTVLNLICAGICYQMFIPVAQRLLERPFPNLHQIDIAFLVILIIGVYGITTIAGIGAAWRLMQVPLTKGVKGLINSDLRLGTSNPVLLSIQFTICLFVFIVALSTVQQMNTLKVTDTGFDKTKIMVISSVPRNWTSEGVNQVKAAMQQLTNLSQVEEISLSYEIPDGNAGNRYSFYAVNGDQTRKVEMPLLKTDRNFNKVYGMAMKQGSFLGAGQPTVVKGGAVINEKAAQVLGWNAQTALGKRIAWDQENTFTVKGVIKDFNFSSLHKSLEPIVIVNLEEYNLYRYISLRLTTTQGNVISDVEQSWKKAFPDTPFDYYFLDGQLNTLYQADRQVSTAASLGTIVLFIIMVLGLVSLLSFSIVRRKKELAIRKVLGAGYKSIFGLLVHQFLLPLGIALGVATGGAYLYLSDWLNNFAYRINMPWFNFLLGGTVLVFMIFLITFWQSLQTGRTNPAKSLSNL